MRAQDSISVTYFGAKGKLVIPLKAIYDEKLLQDNNFWPTLGEGASFSTVPNKDISNLAICDESSTAVSNELASFETQPYEAVESGLSTAGPPVTAHWSREEMNYYQAVLAAEEARKGSEEPDPGNRRLPSSRASFLNCPIYVDEPNTCTADWAGDPEEWHFYRYARPTKLALVHFSPLF